MKGAHNRLRGFTPLISYNIKQEDDEQKISQ
jgi:hypothetical protein